MEILKPFDYTELMDHFLPIYRKFYSNEFDIPSPQGIIDARILKNGSGVSAIGIIKRFAEIILVMNLDSLKISRVKNIDSLIKELLLISKNNSIEQVHSFADESFSKYLVKNYGFEKCIGDPLVLNLGGG